MLIDFREISPNGLIVDSVENIVWLEADSNSGDPIRGLYRFPEPFHVKVRLEKAEENVFVSGSFSGAVTARCVRCLKEYRLNVAETVKLTLMPRSERPREGEDSDRELEADDLDLAYFDEERLDLSRFISEQVFLLLDLYPHCRPDCKGLCPACGIDLNEAACRCAEGQVDTRWAALKQFKTGQ